jgi:NTP pyrophosphatase (non-canonical NTP hydrolase)
MQLDVDNFIASLPPPKGSKSAPKAPREKPSKEKSKPRQAKKTPAKKSSEDILSSLKIEDGELAESIDKLLETINVSKLEGLLLDVVTESIDAALARRSALEEQIAKLSNAVKAEGKAMVQVT